MKFNYFINIILLLKMSNNIVLYNKLHINNNNDIINLFESDNTFFTSIILNDINNFSGNTNEKLNYILSFLDFKNSKINNIIFNLLFNFLSDNIYFKELIYNIKNIDKNYLKNINFIIKNNYNYLKIMKNILTFKNIDIENKINFLTHLDNISVDYLLPVADSMISYNLDSYSGGYLYSILTYYSDNNLHTYNKKDNNLHLFTDFLINNIKKTTIFFNNIINSHKTGSTVYFSNLTNNINSKTLINFVHLLFDFYNYLYNNNKKIIEEYKYNDLCFKCIEYIYFYFLNLKKSNIHLSDIYYNNLCNYIFKPINSFFELYLSDENNKNNLYLQNNYSLNSIIIGFYSSIQNENISDIIVNYISTIITKMNFSSLDISNIFLYNKTDNLNAFNIISTIFNNNIINNNNFYEINDKIIAINSFVKYFKYKMFDNIKFNNLNLNYYSNSNKIIFKKNNQTNIVLDDYNIKDDNINNIVDDDYNNIQSIINIIESQDKNKYSDNKDEKDEKDEKQNIYLLENELKSMEFYDIKNLFNLNDNKLIFKIISYGYELLDLYKKNNVNLKHNFNIIELLYKTLNNVLIYLNLNIIFMNCSHNIIISIIEFNNNLYNYFNSINTELDVKLILLKHKKKYKIYLISLNLFLNIIYKYYNNNSIIDKINYYTILDLKIRMTDNNNIIIDKDFMKNYNKLNKFILNFIDYNFYNFKNDYNLEKLDSNISDIIDNLTFRIIDNPIKIPNSDDFFDESTILTQLYNILENPFTKQYLDEKILYDYNNREDIKKEKEILIEKIKQFNIQIYNEYKNINSKPKPNLNIKKQKKRKIK